MYPKAVQEYFNLVVSQTDEEPEVKRIGRKWTMVSDNGRVRNVATFKVSPGGRTYLSDVHLFVNGVERPTVQNPDEFGKLWHDEDFRQGLKGSHPPAANIEDAPSLIKKLHERLVGALGDELKVGAEKGVWALYVSSEKVEFVIGLRRGRLGILLYLDGVDYTEVVDNQIEKLMELLSGHGISETSRPGDSAPRADSRAQRSRTNGVEVRNTVVIRN